MKTREHEYTKYLRGCVSEKYEEVDGKEFAISTLREFVALLKKYPELHLNYFDGEDDLDLWIKTK